MATALESRLAPPSAGAPTQSRPTMSVRSVCQRSGWVDWAREREERKAVPSELVIWPRLRPTSGPSSRISPKISPLAD